MAVSMVSKETLSKTVAKITRYLMEDRGGTVLPLKFENDGVVSDVIRSVLQVQHIHPGRLTCIITVKPYVCNAYNTLFGGAVGSIAEFIALACARTVVNKDKDLFLGELSVSCLAPAVNQAEVIVDASVVSGRNLTVVNIEFKLKDSKRVAYLCHATFYNMPVASL